MIFDLNFKSTSSGEKERCVCAIMYCVSLVCGQTHIQTHVRARARERFIPIGRNLNKFLTRKKWNIDGQLMRFAMGISLISRLKGSSRHLRGVQKFVRMLVGKMCSMRRKVSTNLDRALHLDTRTHARAQINNTNK